MATAEVSPSFQELIKRQEPLHPDLAEYLEDIPSLGQGIKHPLFFNLFYNENMNGYINKMYESKRKYVDDMLAKGEYESVIWMYERPYRLKLLHEFMFKLSDEDYWKALGHVWADSENLFEYQELLPTLINCPRPGRQYMMAEDEQKFLRSLPDNVAVYRGYNTLHDNRYGYSWSLSYYTAKWFANRFGIRGRVARAFVKKEDIIACFLGRKEYEVVLDPLKLALIKNSRLRDLPICKSLLHVYAKAREVFKLRISSHHGTWHWEKVYLNAIALHALAPGADLKVVRLFAILHDCKRESELEDPDHGRRSGEYVRELFKDGVLAITPKERDLLITACAFHNEGHTSKNPTLGVCWDADRLDLPRVGITPDKKYLSTRAGKRLMWKI